MTENLFTVDDFKRYEDTIKHTSCPVDFQTISYIRDEYPSNSLMIMRGIQLGMFLANHNNK